MARIRNVIASIVSIIYIVLLIKKVEVSQTLYVFLLGIILTNQALEEWSTYLQTRNKIHLLIPITAVLIIIFVIFNVLN